MLVVAIMAGGKGTRLWPKSRPECPKPYQAFLGEESLLQLTVRRAAGLVPPGQILIVTERRYGDLTAAQAPGLPRRQLLLEPTGRDTAACLGLAALAALRLEPEAVLAVLPADHYVGDEAAFLAALRRAARAAADDRVVMIGLRPTGPQTGYGYIDFAPEPDAATGGEAHRVRQFIEKPDHGTAAALCARPDMLWNGGIFIGRARRFLDLIDQHLPELRRGLAEIAPALGTADEEAVLEAVYPTLPVISIDFGIAERCESLWVVPGDFPWDDLGNWDAVHRLSPREQQGNALKGEVIARDTRDSLIWDEVGLTVAVGVTNLAIVRTPEALLVCERGQAQSLRGVVAQVRSGPSVPRMPPTWLSALGRAEGAKVVQKPWGREIWWALTDAYAAKVLEVKAGESLSLQYHCHKLETMLCLSGQGRLIVGERLLSLIPGVVVTIPPGTVHRLAADADLTMVEVSTPHLEDVVRVSDRYGRGVGAPSPGSAGAEG